jgi:hypothetical protein
MFTLEELHHEGVNRSRRGTGTSPRLTGAWGSGWDPMSMLFFAPAVCWGKRWGKRAERDKIVTRYQWLSLCSGRILAPPNAFARPRQQQHR